MKLLGRVPEGELRAVAPALLGEVPVVKTGRAQGEGSGRRVRSDLSTQTFEDDADHLLGREAPPGGSPNVLTVTSALCGVFLSRCLIVSLRGVKMSRKLSLTQSAHSVRWVLTRDTLKRTIRTSFKRVGTFAHLANSAASDGTAPVCRWSRVRDRFDRRGLPGRFAKSIGTLLS